MHIWVVTHQVIPQQWFNPTLGEAFASQEASFERYERLLSLPDDSRLRMGKAAGGVSVRSFWFPAPPPIKIKKKTSSLITDPEVNNKRLKSLFHDLGMRTPNKISLRTLSLNPALFLDIHTFVAKKHGFFPTPPAPSTARYAFLMAFHPRLGADSPARRFKHQASRATLVETLNNDNDKTRFLWSNNIIKWIQLIVDRSTWPIIENPFKQRSCFLMVG